ncbi:MAG: hypothetical protein K8L97_10785 [Anaerolineae bacterium]|nr:hypothetical protein [Anaerolineae bacterium]
MEGIEAAILRTVLYADVFNFPMTAKEIHHFLIHDEPVSLESVCNTLATSTALKTVLNQVEGYVVYGERTDIIAVRQIRETASEHLWPVAMRYGRWLARLPFVRMVALTGALAMRNAAADDDDLDYILVTAPGRVWLARGFAIALVRLARVQGVEVCPNYVLAESALSQERHDIFMAHEVVQMVPLYGHRLYERFRAANLWVGEQLPNATDAFYKEIEQQTGWFWNGLKWMAESILGGQLGDWLENWEYRRKLQRFAQDMQKPHSSAKLDDSHVKGHFDDHGHPVLQKYYTRLREYGLEAQPSAVPGD